MWGLLTIVAFIGLSGCANRIPEDAPNLLIQDATARSTTEAQNASPTAWQTPDGPLALGPNGMVFMTIDNQGGGADRLLKAACDAAQKVELHMMSIVGEQASTSPVQQIDIPAKTKVVLQPGGYYLRLVGLKRKLANGEKITVKLEFEKSGEKSVTVAVLNP
jgi:copper(I)-binding protein